MGNKSSSNRCYCFSRQQPQPLSWTSHTTQTSHWIPPLENWDSNHGLPYGWESAIDRSGKLYFINHLNKGTTYDDPRHILEYEPPKPREVELKRDSQMGFGFVAGSEKPVIVRFVTEGGPSVDKLLPGDQILKINGEDVKKAPRDHVIELVRSCKETVILTVCQPYSDNSNRKSAFLSAAKRARLKSNPSRVRFAEGVIINGSPIISPSINESYIPLMPNVLKVFLENGQTKSFKYDSKTTVKDVLDSLQQKLNIQSMENFCLVVEHIKSLRHNKLTLLYPQEALAKIAAKPGAQHLRCLFRVIFVPRDIYDLLRKDAVAFEYFFMQCCNDVIQERFASELRYDVVLRLAAFHIQQHALVNNITGKLSVKSIEREFGLERFIPPSLLEVMKRKELRKLLAHFLKLNQNLSPPGQKRLTALQAKLQYLKILSELPTFGGRCFATTLRESDTEAMILVSPKYGISQISGTQSGSPVLLTEIESLASVTVLREDEVSQEVEIKLKDVHSEKGFVFVMDTDDVDDLVVLLQGYYKLFTNEELPVDQEESRVNICTVPPYHGKHCVHPSPWSYPSGLMSLMVSDNIDDKKVSHLEKEYIVDLSCGPPSYNITVSSTKEIVQTQEVTEKIKESESEEPSRTNSNTSVIASAPTNPPDELDVSTQTQEVSIKPPELEVSCAEDKVVEIQEEKTPSSSDHAEGETKTLDTAEDELSVDIHNSATVSASPEMPQNMNQDSKLIIPEAVSSHLLFEHLGLICTETADGEPSLSVPISDEFLGKFPLLKATDSLLLLTQGGQGEVYWNEPSESDTDSMSTPTDSPSHRPTPRPIVSPILFKSGSSFGLHSPDNLPAGYLPSEAELQQLAQQLGLQDPQLPFSFAEGTLYLDPDIIDLTMIPPPITPDQEKTVDFLPSISTPPTPFADKETDEFFNEVTESVNNVIVPPIEPQNSPSFRGKRSGQKHRIKDEIWTDISEKHQAATYFICRFDYDSDSGNETISSENVEMSSQETSQDITDNLNILDFSQCLYLNGFPMDGQFSAITDSHDIDSFIARVTIPPPPPLLSDDLPIRTSSLSEINYFIIPPPPLLDSSPVNENISEYTLNKDLLETEGQKEIEKSKTTETDSSKSSDTEITSEICQSPESTTILYLEPGTHMTQSTTESDNEDNDAYKEKVSQEKASFTSHSFDNSLPSSPSLKCKRSSSFQDISTSENQHKVLGFRTPAPVRKSSLGNSRISDNQLISDPSLSKTTQSKKTSVLGLNRLKKFEGLSKKIPISSQASSKLSKSQINEDSEPQTKGPKVSPPHQRTSSLGTKVKAAISSQEKEASFTSKSTKASHFSKISHESAGYICHKGSLKEPSLPSRVSKIPSSHSISANDNGDHGSEKFNGPYMSRKSNNGQCIKSNSPSSPEKVSSSFSPKKFLSVKQSDEQAALVISKKEAVESKPISKFYSNTQQTVVPPSLRFDDPYEKCRFTTFKTTSSNKKESTSLSSSSSTSGSKLPIMKSKVHNMPIESSKLRSPSKMVQFKANLNAHLTAEELELSLPQPDYPTDGNEELQLAQDQISSIIKQMDTVLETLKSFTTETNMEKFLYAKDMLVSESRQFVTASKLFVKSATESEEKVVQNLKHCVAMLRCICETAFTVAEHSDSVSQAQNLISKVRDVATTFRNNVNIAAKVVGKPLSDPGMKALMQQATNLATALTALMRTLRVIDLPT